MNDLLQKHGCANVFTVPDGLKELMSDITREVLREQPAKIYDFITNYLSALLITREHGIMAVKILEDLCDCKPSVSEHLIQLGFSRDESEPIAQVIKEEIEGTEGIEANAKVKETQIIKKILTRRALDEDMAAKVCQVARNAYKDYWYRKKLLERNMKMHPDEPWEIAAQHTLEIYKTTKPSFTELSRATERIQAAYKGYHVRRNILRHLRPKSKKRSPKVDLPGPPLDIAASREIDLGPVINLKVKVDNVNVMFDDDVKHKLGLKYDTKKTITHVKDNYVVQQVSLNPNSFNTNMKNPSSRHRRQSSQSPIPFYTSDVETPRTSRSQTSNKSNRLQSPSKSYQSQTYGSRPQSPWKTDLQIQEKKSLDTYPAKSVRKSSAAPKSGLGYIHKISFANVSAEIIPLISSSDNEISDPVLEIPEDIPDNRSEGDGASVPTASATTSASVSDASDIEDAVIADVDE